MGRKEQEPEKSKGRIDANIKGDSPSKLARMAYLCVGLSG